MFTFADESCYIRKRLNIILSAVGFKRMVGTHNNQLELLK